MYKLLILSFFFSMVAVSQNIPPVTNQENTQKSEKKVETHSQIKEFSSQEQLNQMKLFTLNVQEIQEELTTISFSSTRKSPSSAEILEMNKQLKVLEAINAQSFEYNLLNYQVGNYDFSRLGNLKAAERLQPNNASVLKEFTAYSYIMNDEVELKKYLIKLSNQQIFSKDLQLYAENTLQSLPVNSILITHGEKDTYPLLIQQKIKNTRSDVQIISLAHLQSEEYRKRLKKLGFTFPKTHFVDTHFFNEFMKLNSTKDIIVGASVPRPYLVNGGDYIHTVGLGMAFYSFGLYNDADNQKLYEKSMKLLIEKHISQSIEKQLLGNYLPFLFSVRNSYLIVGGKVRLDEIDALILKVAKLCNKDQQVKSLMNK